MNLNPELLFDMVANTVPKDLHPNILIVGSLAAAYHHRNDLTAQVVATKDADVMVQPAGAVSECAAIATRLLAAGWRRTEQCYPRTDPKPVDDVRAIRLHPREIDAFFIELLGLPDPGQQPTRIWVPCKLDDGWYGIPCFKFMALLESDRRDTKFGIQHASPPLMALANLLSHPRLGDARMEGAIEGRRILRSAKDLGRALSLAWLEPRDLADWLPLWAAALRTHFRADLRALAANAANGLRRLLDDAGALEQAHFTTSVGLLRGHAVSTDQLRITAERMMADLIGPLAEQLRDA
jgi:hypothetical protein